jgi:hypothetical protein
MSTSINGPDGLWVFGVLYSTLLASPPEYEIAEYGDRLTRVPHSDRRTGIA